MLKRASSLLLITSILLSACSAQNQSASDAKDMKGDTAVILTEKKTKKTQAQNPRLKITRQILKFILKQTQI